MKSAEDPVSRDAQEVLLREDRNGVTYLTLNRPERMNALSAELQEKLEAQLWDADNDKSVHCVVLSGRGRCFSAGYDLQAAGGSASAGRAYRDRASLEDDVWYLEQQQQRRMAIWDMHKPVIAAVHGYCLAGGLDLALLCDIVVIAEDTVVGYPPVRAQGSPAAHMWTYLAGPQWAKRMLLTGDSITGTEAAAIGLAYKAVPADALDAEVRALARKMAMIDVELLAVNKRSVNLALELMGARTMQRLSAELDARGHQAPSFSTFRNLAAKDGLKAALRWRDDRFE
ncbi:MAG: crotonase/enoyl-CoA hydratase family protein [Dehalococcoidia bacterium]